MTSNPPAPAQDPSPPLPNGGPVRVHVLSLLFDRTGPEIELVYSPVSGLFAASWDDHHGGDMPGCEAPSRKPGHAKLVFSGNGATHCVMRRVLASQLAGKTLPYRPHW